MKNTKQANQNTTQQIKYKTNKQTNKRISQTKHKPEQHNTTNKTKTV